MWELYLKTDEGVAIETTFGRFRDSFSAEKIQKVFIGQVNYIDYDTEPVPWDNFLFMPLHKRKSFAHEQELRALVWLLINTDTDTTRPPPPGINVHVQLTTLLQRVFVSPEAAGWYVEIIGSILEKYGYGTVPLVQSNLYSLK
jgi:hypothetical protein